MLRGHPDRAAPWPGLRVEAGRVSGVAISPLLFGLGVDLPAQSYFRPGDPTCKALAGADGIATLVRIGAATADDYDWRTDEYFNPLAPGRRPLEASFGCSAPGPAATIVRVLDRVRLMRATAVVVLNGEVDDPQSAAGLARFIAARYGAPFAQRLYWEIGNAPAQWQHFGVPLPQRHPGEHVRCSPDQYAALVTTYAAALSAALGASPLIVADAWIANATDQSWSDVVSAVDTRFYAYNSPDTPLSGAQIARGAATLGGQIAGLHADLAAEQGQKMPLFVGQWNIDASPQAPNPLYGSGAQAAFVAGLMLQLIRDSAGGVVTMAAWGQPLYTTSQSPFTEVGAPRPGWHLFAALRAMAGGHLLETRNAAGLPGLAARLADGRVAIVMVNADAHATTARLRIDGAGTHMLAATTETISNANPNGLAGSIRLEPTGTTLRIPALGVVIVTGDRR